MPFAFSILILGLKLGLDTALLVVLPVFGYVIKKITDNESRVTYDIEAWSNAVESAIQNNQEAPSLEHYEITECQAPNILNAPSQ